MMHVATCRLGKDLKWGMRLSGLCLESVGWWMLLCLYMWSMSAVVMSDRVN